MSKGGSPTPSMPLTSALNYQSRKRALTLMSAVLANNTWRQNRELERTTC
jgi:hypothetical protein